MSDFRTAAAPVARPGRGGMRASGGSSVPALSRRAAGRCSVHPCQVAVPATSDRPRRGKNFCGPAREGREFRPMKLPEHRNLPRLAREHYQGLAVVHWTHTLEKRATGWLNERFHMRFREILLHACSRHDLVCPAYTLMPDHMHVVWMGASGASDQLNAAAFLRKHSAPIFRPARLQDRAHDRVLRENERRRHAFEELGNYVLENPERAELCPDWRAWPYAGAMVPGYPIAEPRQPAYWEGFWKLYHLRLNQAAADRVPPLPGRATGREADEPTSVPGPSGPGHMKREQRPQLGRPPLGRPFEGG